MSRALADQLIAQREERGDALERIDLFKNGKEAVEAAEDFIVDAEALIKGPKAGERRLEVAAIALAAVIEVPILPEAGEVAIAKVILQTVFNGVDDLGDLIKKVGARRKARKAARKAKRKEKRAARQEKKSTDSR